MNRRVAESVGREQEFTRNEWSLEEEGMERGVKLNIAKARWICIPLPASQDGHETEQETEHTDIDEQTEQTDDNRVNTDGEE